MRNTKKVIIAILTIISIMTLTGCEGEKNIVGSEEYGFIQLPKKYEMEPMEAIRGLNYIEKDQKFVLSLDAGPNNKFDTQGLAETFENIYKNMGGEELETKNVTLDNKEFKEIIYKFKSQVDGTESILCFWCHVGDNKYMYSISIESTPKIYKKIEKIIEKNYQIPTKTIEPKQNKEQNNQENKENK